MLTKIRQTTWQNWSDSQNQTDLAVSCKQPLNLANVDKLESSGRRRWGDHLKARDRLPESQEPGSKILYNCSSPLLTLGAFYDNLTNIIYVGCFYKNDYFNVIFTYVITTHRPHDAVEFVRSFGWLLKLKPVWLSLSVTSTLV
jgi:hypothetical protein